MGTRLVPCGETVKSECIDGEMARPDCLRLNRLQEMDPHLRQWRTGTR